MLRPLPVRLVLRLESKMWRLLVAILATTCLGCAATGRGREDPQEPPLQTVAAGRAAIEDSPGMADIQLLSFDGNESDSGAVSALAGDDMEQAPPLPSADSAGQNSGDTRDAAVDTAQPATATVLSLDEVLGAVYRSYPLLAAVQLEREIATGQQLAAAGEYDLKVRGAFETTPAGFYETYRNGIGLVQPLYTGGEAFAGYRVGRGSFEPWYRERQTNSGGEFKAGVAIPLSRDRHIDPRRAELWQATYGRQLAEPEIQAQLLGFVQEASYAYWGWVAAGAKFRIAERLLQLAEERTARIERQVAEDLLDPPELTDNLRLVAERRGKLADASRKLQQSAVKLSLFYRDAIGDPVIPSPELLPDFPEAVAVDLEMVSFDSQRALQQRPEIETIRLIQRQLEVDYAGAHNEFRPAIDAVMAASQDVGNPTSKRDDKSQLQVDAAILVDVPLQRRKARGKMQAVDAKISQLNAKRRMVEDKIVAEVQAVYSGLDAAAKQVRQAQQAVEYAEDLAQRERRNFELGVSDLLKVTLREQYAFESAEKAVDATLLYFESRADYRAALGEDRP